MYLCVWDCICSSCSFATSSSSPFPLLDLGIVNIFVLCMYHGIYTVASRSFYHDLYPEIGYGRGQLDEVGAVSKVDDELMVLSRRRSGGQVPSSAVKSLVMICLVFVELVKTVDSRTVVQCCPELTVSLLRS